MFNNFKEEYYGFNSLVGGTQVNFAAFKSLFPIIVFDVRKQKERLKTGYGYSNKNLVWTTNPC